MLHARLTIVPGADARDDDHVVIAFPRLGQTAGFRDFSPYEKAAPSRFITVRLQRPVLFRLMTLRILLWRQVRDRFAVGILRIYFKRDEDFRIARVIVAGLKDSPPFLVLNHHAPQDRQIIILPMLIDQTYRMRRIHVSPLPFFFSFPDEKPNEVGFHRKGRTAD